jgi:CMP-N-acetylneuraminic acid synthetase
MKTIALLTARGNNTLPNKNILHVSGRPLLHYPALAAKRCSRVSNFYVSSDCEKILDAALDVGYAKIRRPAELALPQSQHMDTIAHAVEEIKNREELPEILVVLLGNSVTVKTSWIDACIQRIENDTSISSVVPVFDGAEYHPFRAKTIDDQGLLKTFFDFGSASTNRQDLPICYFLCHNFWVLNLNRVSFNGDGQQPWTFLGDRISPFPVSEAFDVHHRDDLKRSEKWLLENRNYSGAGGI